ncbi:hypothetical protein F511_26667 [Dorcoceras hygrometricum]|uniref:Uncharacterized protein n=1 Tax=Dorcoceras hygrometricum TaxID=472368 RepID=A0A2Z7BWU3_9LAMI|nr:hypothetical protein F511_26667 [Dorcoceras hygrometricum]
MVNPCWLLGNFDICTEFLPPGCISDHSLSITTFFKAARRRNIPFKFYNMWCSHADFENLIRDNWFLHGHGTQQFLLKKRLAKLKTILKNLNSMHFSSISSRADAARIKLEELQLKILNGDTIMEDIVEVRRKAEFLLQAENMFFMQKSKCLYLRNGDRCSKFFHDLIKRSNKRRRILAVTKADGNHSFDEHDIQSEFVNYFMNLLGVSYNREQFQAEFFQDGPKVTMDEAAKLIVPISMGEVFSALSSIDNEKHLDRMVMVQCSLRKHGILLVWMFFLL